MARCSSCSGHRFLPWGQSGVLTRAYAAPARCQPGTGPAASLGTTGAAGG